MTKLDKQRIYYEGIIYFKDKNNTLAFEKTLYKTIRYGYIIHTELWDNKTLVFNCVVNVDRKSHEVDKRLKALIERYKSLKAIESVRIDKMYLTNPIILSAYLNAK
jgi:hypothetical protein